MWRNNAVVPTLKRLTAGHCLVIPIGMLAALLTLWRLDNYCLWQDEAQTALLSRSVMQQGVPLANDGRNNFGQELGSEYDDQYRWRWHPWLPFYVLAGFFVTFGESTLVARLPFGLFGVATVVGCYYLSFAIWRDRRAAAAAGLILALSVPFLILSRQCRYYSPTAFFSVLTLLGYWRVVSGEHFGRILFISSSILLFHTNFVSLYTLLAALAVHGSLWHRARLKLLVTCGVVLMIACLPGMIWFSGTVYFARYGSVMFNAAAYWRHLTYFVKQIDRHVFSFWLLDIPVISLLIHLSRNTHRSCLHDVLLRGLSCLLLVIAVNLAVLPLVVPAAFLRYIVVLLPIGAILIARMAITAARWHWTVGVMVVAFTIGRGPLLEYTYELTHEFRGPVEGIVAYLHTHARPSDVVGMTYEDLPIKFYTRLRVVGGFTGEDLSPATDAEWIILRHYVVDSSKESRVRDFLLQELETGRYKKIEIDYPDTKWQNREEPVDHLFRTAVDEPRVILWRRSNN